MRGARPAGPDPGLNSVSRRLQVGPLIVASHNAGKVREIGALLAPFGYEVLAAADLGLDEPEETGRDFIANAELKARAAAEAAGLPALSDDSGLEVAALSGAPGIYAARWAGPGRDFAKAMERVHKEMVASGDENPSARFVCALSLCWPDGHCESVEGEVRGRITWPPRGEKGFGYDPIFIADGETLTFGEMEPEAKHAISHRADAFAKLIDRCLGAG
ncbi:MAG: RdgB/HAM1 family non-canonical purine NTP pyrophosphatase [Alphaproteobacteria bacterium]|nr:RdgB/HAM1 family non-canonical purine NTP pyrophosphatase [Alphaproteobacteria bacterium]